MTSYEQLLLRPEWFEFRERFIRSRDNPSWCDCCGESTKLPLQVHHRRYIKDRLPWEYEFTDLRLLCSKCHERIHTAENDARNMIRALPPWVMPELTQFLVALRDLDDRGKQIAFARAKSAARNIRHCDSDFDTMPKSMKELMLEWLESMKDRIVFGETPEHEI